MKNTWLWVLVVLVVLLGIGGYIYSKRGAEAPNLPINNGSQEVADIRGCYAVRVANDVYTFNVKTQTPEGDVTGTLNFKNFEKDSSSGTFKGTYKDGILLALYSFRSEGMDSVMQVIFKKIDEGFVRGYGEVDTSGTRFKDPGTVTYEVSPLSVFREETCV